MKIRETVALLALCAVFQSWPARAQIFTLRGVYSWKVLNQGNTVKEDTYVFLVERSNDLCSVRSTSMAGQNTEDQQILSDQSDSYALIQRWPDWNAQNKHKLPDEMGFVLPDAFPRRSSRPVQCLSLLAGSSAYFPSPTNDFALPMERLDYVPKTQGLTIVDRLSGNPGFVQRVTTFCSNSISVQGKTVPLPPIYGGRFLAWDLRVLETTNQREVVFPLRFNFKQYYPNFLHPASAEDESLIYEADFTVTQIDVGSLAAGLFPECASRAEVEDLRIDAKWKNGLGPGTNLSLYYYVTNNNWRTPFSAPSL